MEESFNLCHLVLANSGPFGNNFVKDLKTTLIQPAGGAGCHNRVLKVLMYICLLKILLPIDIVISYNGSVEKKRGKSGEMKCPGECVGSPPSPRDNHQESHNGTIFIIIANTKTKKL